LKPKVHCKWRIMPVKCLLCSITAFQKQSTSNLPFIDKHLLFLQWWFSLKVRDYLCVFFQRICNFFHQFSKLFTSTVYKHFWTDRLLHCRRQKPSKFTLYYAYRVLYWNYFASYYFTSYRLYSRNSSDNYHKGAIDWYNYLL
jgi:hypothetical protein